MRYKVRPEDFRVKEQVRLPPGGWGRFAIYRVRKRGLTTMAVQARMAHRLNVSQADVVFPALKDKVALAIQYATVRTDRPRYLDEEGFEAEVIGRMARPLAPTDILANRFTLTLRDMSEDEVTAVHRRAEQIGEWGVPNYFDRQRFGSFAPGREMIGKLILRRDAEGALKEHLTRPFVGDPAEVVRFKRFAAAHWPDWERLFEAAPRPSNFRSVLTYLRDHPGEAESVYRKALDLITRRVLSLYLAAYQSLLWNRIAGRYLRSRLGEPPTTIEIAGEQLPFHRAAPGIAPVLPLPHHRAVYRPEVTPFVTQVLAEEGLRLHDLKARILKKAYLSHSERPVWVRPQVMNIPPPAPDDLFPGRQRLTVSFTLPRGSYGTLVITALSIPPDGPVILHPNDEDRL